MELGEPDASGRRRPVAIEGAIDTIDVDEVIVSVGVSPNPLIPVSYTHLDVYKRQGVNSIIPMVHYRNNRGSYPCPYRRGIPDGIRGGSKHRFPGHTINEERKYNKISVDELWQMK